MPFLGSFLEQVARHPEFTGFDQRAPIVSLNAKRFREFLGGRFATDNSLVGIKLLEGDTSAEIIGRRGGQPIALLWWRFSGDAGQRGRGNQPGCNGKAR